MRFNTKKSFQKAYNKLKDIDKDRVDQALVLFEADPFAKSLRNHSVWGKYPWCRTIDAWFDLRVLFKEDDKLYNLITLIEVWSHSELYG